MYVGKVHIWFSAPPAAIIDHCEGFHALLLDLG